MDEQQIREIIDRHSRALALYARQWCSWPEDAVQEAMCELVRQSTQPENIPAWLFRTVRFKAMNIARSERRRESHQRSSAYDRDPWFEQSCSMIFDGEEIQLALLKLGAVEREIVIAKIWGELTFEQISEITDKPLTTVHRHYHHAIDQLRLVIQKSAGPKP